jgi:flagellar biosynthetic protein FlhB
MSEERTEKPTARKKKENKKEGTVPRTQELGAWGSMLAVGLALPPLVSREIDTLRTFFDTDLRVAGEPSVAGARDVLQQGLGHALLALVLLGAGVAVIGTGAALAQGGFYLATKAVKPSFSKINPFKGAKRIFGTQMLWEGAKMLLKASIVAALVWSTVKTLMPLIGGLVPMSTVIQTGSGHVLSMLRNVALAGLVMAAADYGFQRFKVGKKARMTKDEVKREYKQTEGDPLIKAAIRSRQLAAARNRMMADIPDADVVLVNPTHVAIALRYQPERGAPRVVARGAGAIAMRIREKATESGVPLVRDVPLARALYRHTQVGQEIPPELFAAVAQVLAYVISRKRQGRVAGEHASPRTSPDLPTVGRGGRRRVPVTKPSTLAPAGRSTS